VGGFPRIFYQLGKSWSSFRRNHFNNNRHPLLYWPSGEKDLPPILIQAKGARLWPLALIVVLSRPATIKNINTGTQGGRFAV
jgi:hypothetical protein